MGSCVNDLSPIILAVAAVISVQVPIVVSHFVAASQVKARYEQMTKVAQTNGVKLDNLTSITSEAISDSSNSFGGNALDPKKP